MAPVRLLFHDSWQDVPGATTLNATVALAGLTAGTHLFRLAVRETATFSSLQCRVVSNQVTIVAEPQPVAGYGITDTATMTATINLLALPTAKFYITPADITIFHPTITFTDQSTGAADCQIDWGDGTITGCAATRHDYTAPGTYRVKEIVRNVGGCYDTAYARVIIRPEFRFGMPNVFTPNGDGLNDIFKPVLFGVYDYALTIFSRWGEQVFITTDPATGWDGTFRGNLCQPDVYIFKITFRDEVENSYKVKSGTFLLLR